MVEGDQVEKSPSAQIERPDSNPTRRDVLKAGLRYGRGLAGAGAISRLLPPAYIAGLLGNIESHGEHLPVYELPPLPEFKKPDRDQRVVVIPMLRDDETERGSVYDLEEILAKVGYSFRDDSYGNLNYQFKVLPPRLADLPKVTGSFDKHSEIARIGNELLDEMQLTDLDQYQTRMYVVRPDPVVGTSGKGWDRYPNQYNQAWIYAFPDDMQRQLGFFPSLLKHELGHTLGMPHANSTESGKANKEYGGIDDTMGTSPDLAAGFNAPQRVSMGWIGREQVQSIHNDGVYTLDALDFANQDKLDLTRVLRIQKPDTNERYYISFRPQGSLLGGIDIHRWNEKRKSSPNEVMVSAAMRNGWRDGDVWRDEANGITIRQVSTSGSVSYVPAESVKIEVVFDKR